MPTYALVQRLLAAKRDLRPEKELAVLDSFDAILLDDIDCVQQSRDEMEVLSTFSPSATSEKASSSPATWSSANGTGSSRTR